MANRTYNQFSGSQQRGVVSLMGRIALGTGGALAATQTYTAKQMGFTVTKTANKTGRYTITFTDKFKDLLNYNVGIISPTADAAVTTDTGTIGVLRVQGASLAADLATGILTLQFVRPWTSTTTSTNVDAELETNAHFTLRFDFKNLSI